MVEAMHAKVIDGAPAVWDGRRYRMGVQAIKDVVQWLCPRVNRSQKAEVADWVGSAAPRVESATAFDGRRYVAFANATVDCSTMEAVEPSPDMFITGVLTCDYDPEARSGDVRRFLASVSAGVPEVTSALLDVTAACMTSSHVLNQSPLLIGVSAEGDGTASNGKSTFINALRALLGSENYSSLDPATIGQRFQSARLMGRLANLGDDISPEYLSGDALSVFKKIVTGETIYCDVKGGDGFEFVPTATQVFSMNDIPRLGDSTSGVMRRLAPIPFRAHFDPEKPGFDPDIGRKLATRGAAATLAFMALSHVERVAERGVITAIPGAAEFVEQVRRNNDSVAAWIWENGITAEKLAYGIVEVAEAYRDYKAQTIDATKKPVDSGNFTRKVLKLVPNVRTVRDQSGGRDRKLFEIADMG